jgi:hypothetical protein
VNYKQASATAVIPRINFLKARTLLLKRKAHKDVRFLKDRIRQPEEDE